MHWVCGVVMETTGQHVIVMTPDGEFKRVRIKGTIPDIGDEIRVPVVHKRYFNMPKTSWVAMAAAVILIMIASPLLTVINQPPEVAAYYVAIDINPSIELTVSNRSNVLDSQAYNVDGQKLLAGIKKDLKGVKYDEAIGTIKEEAIKLGFIRKSENNSVLVSLTQLPDVKVDKSKFEKTLLATANSIFADNDVKVASIYVPSGTRESAMKKGMSPGKYVVLIEAVNAGLAVTEKDMQEKSITVAISNAGGQPDDIISQAREEEEFEVKEKKFLLIAGGQISIDHQGINELEGINSSEVDSKPEETVVTPEKETKYVDTVIRRDGSPEDRSIFEDKKPAKNPSIATTPEKPDDDPEPNTSIGKPSISDVPDDDSDEAIDDTNKNYMGPDSNENNSNNNDMYILRPNF